MPTVHRHQIQDVLSIIENGYRWIFEEFQEFPLPEGAALDIGCDSGYEAIAMQWFFGVEKVIGIDKDISTVSQFIPDLVANLEESSQTINYSYVSQADRTWWNTEVPQFLRDCSLPEFKQVDITLPKVLSETIGENTCGFAYCSNVLYIVHEKSGPEGVRVALRQILRVLRPEAWFIAQEPPEDDITYFQEEFLSAGFKVNMTSNLYKVEFRAQRQG